MTVRALLEQTAGLAVAHLEGLTDRPVSWSASVEELRASLGGPVPEIPTEACEVIDHLAAAVEPGLVGSPGGRYFGFVIGGGMPAAVAADWLTSAWDQNAGLFVCGPAAAIAEEVAGAWVGWDVNERGLIGASPLRIFVGAERHVTVDRALRLLGFGSASIVAIPADGQGRMMPDALREALGGGDGPSIICAQVGNVNTGSCDPMVEIADIADETGAWLHVDGAFGLWAAASPALRHLVAGVERADSWATDAHKWLNVPYDCGIAFCAHPEAHQAAMSVHAGYLVHADADGPRDQLDWNPEFSRRARGFSVYAAIHSLGLRDRRLDKAGGDHDA
jgi:glutamate/tyrosine decarboxylase-like PLP-dependent enzyme